MKELIDNFKFTWKYLKNVKGYFYLYLFMNLFFIIISIIIPIISAKMIISLTSNNFYQLFIMSIVIFIVENIRNIVNYFASKCTQHIYRETMINLQYDLAFNILKLENKVVDDNGSGLFIQRLTNDTSRISDVFNTITMDIANIITYLGIFIAIFFINKVVFIYLLIMTLILYIVENIRTKNRNEKDKIYRKELEKVSGFIGELVRGIRDIKMLNSENSFLDELYSKVKNANQSGYDMGHVNRKFILLGGFTIDLTDLLLVFLLIYLIMNNQVPVASALIIYNYSGRIASIVNYIGTLLDRLQDFNLSTNRIKAIIESPEFEKEQFGNIHLDKINGDFEFKNVTFSYNEKKVLNKINFKVNANETVAFVGKSGAGKTTIFNLLCKMYKVDNGEITIDGININALDKDSIRGNITIISQNPYIFNLSIKDNLKLVKKDVTDKEIKEACKIACLDEFINSLPDKYETIIGEGGVNLSGGQKQRLAIARALIQKTEIILFDEATSALDNETQSEIQNAINNLKGEYTILIVAHRLSTVIDSDKIFVIDNGTVIDSGTHNELLKRCNEYKKLYEKDLNL